MNLEHLELYQNLLKKIVSQRPLDKCSTYFHQIFLGWVITRCVSLCCDWHSMLYYATATLHLLASPCHNTTCFDTLCHGTLSFMPCQDKLCHATVCRVTLAFASVIANFVCNADDHASANAGAFHYATGMLYAVMLTKAVCSILWWVLCMGQLIDCEYITPSKHTDGNGPCRGVM